MNCPFNEQRYRQLLKGLECNVVMLSTVLENKDFRVDSNFCIGIPIKNSLFEYRKIGDCLIKSYYGLSVSMNENGVGYPIYRMNELHNMLADLEVAKYADIDTEEFEKFQLKNRDVLFNRTNSYEFVGRTGIYYKNDEKNRTFASYLVCFNPDETIILPEYLTAFLNSRQGIWDIKRRARQSINQTNVNPEEVKQIDIPILSMVLQKQIQNNFELANTKRIEANITYHSAEQLLLKSLGLENWQPKNEKTTIKNFSDFQKAGRLDAEYYQPKYEELENKIKKNKFGYCELGNIVMTRRGSLISDVYYTNNRKCLGYIRGADISSNVLLDDKLVYIDNKFSCNGETKCQYNDVVFSMIGSVGTMARVTKEFNGFYISNNLGLMRVINSEILSEFLCLYLSNKNLGGMFFEKKEMRTAQPKISDKDILDILIPKIDKSIQQQIADKVQESFRLRQESKELLERAKRAVEIAIEEGEDKAMYWLKYENKNKLYDTNTKISLAKVAEGT